MVKTTKPRTVPYRRKREGKTQYLKRLKLLVGQKTRLVVRFTNQKIIAQLVNFTPKGDVVVVGCDSYALRKFGWTYSGKNYPAAYLTGYLLAKKAVRAGVLDAILDTGLNAPFAKGKTYAFLKGALDGGLKVPCGEKEIFPDEARVSGEHIKSYGGMLKRDSVAYERQFTQYLKSKALPESVVDVFKQVKQKINV